MNNESRIFGVSMAGWICFVLTLGLTAGVLMKIPIDTQYFTIINSVVVAYVVRRLSVPQQPNGENKPKI